MVFKNTKKVLQFLGEHINHSNSVSDAAKSMDIKLVFLPPYSPDLNPIEFVWKSGKRIVSTTSINSEMDMKSTIERAFMKLSESRTFEVNWNRKILNESMKV